MSVTAFENEATSKSLEDAGFTDVQIVALMECMRQSTAIGGRAPAERDKINGSPRDADQARGGSIAHAIAMLVLGIGGLGALLAILIRVA
jgi:hypothetical protein